MSENLVAGHDNATGPFAPLRVVEYRRVWSSSLLSSFGHLILGVAAAWEMTRLSASPTMVALVQTALMLPLMLVALPAGALADMFDRRRIALAGLTIAVIAGCMTTTVSLLGLMTPWLLLGLIFVSGSGVALYSPAWQASISELVPVAQLPAAVSLGSISYNLARSFGPALGGAIILALGVEAAYGINALGYIPLIVTFLLWKRVHIASRLPPEGIGRALISGFRYARNASAVRNVLIRGFAYGLASATGTALAPLIAKEMLQGDAVTFGILLGAGGAGAVLGSLSVSTLRERFGPESSVRLWVVVGGAALAGIALSRNVAVTCALYALQGAANMIVISMLNVGVQMSSPRWVTARALSLFSSSLTGGIALGAVIWGEAAARIGLTASILASGVLLATTAMLGFLFPLFREMDGAREPARLRTEPNVALALTARSGPIAIEIDYRVDPDRARAFYQAMMPIQRMRQRNGAFAWSLSRSIGDPSLWTERYECPTWGAYLHLRERMTKADIEAQARAEAFNELHTEDRVRRRLERPYGSVRWREEAPDPGQTQVGLFAP